MGWDVGDKMVDCVRQGGTGGGGGVIFVDIMDYGILNAKLRYGVQWSMV